MQNNTINGATSYEELVTTYDKANFFEEIAIQINYIKNITGDICDKERPYRIISIEDKTFNNEDRHDELKEFIDHCNEQLTGSCARSRWQIFYLYKELFQFFINDKDNYNYFRGQSNNEDLLPGILRESVQSSYRSNFESLYQKIAKEFPDKISYVELKDDNSIEDRECQLSLLQHYGIKTSLLDITSNPYIAMLFMLSEKFDKYKEPTFFLFRVDENNCDREHLFTEVRRNKVNERIEAQKGAFLNFAKLCLNNKLEKIPLVKISLHFSSEAFKEQIAIENKQVGEITSTPTNEEGLSDYKEMLRKESESIEKSKIDCLNFIRDELIQKLREYFYFEEDLFPDFENRIRYLSNKYQGSTVDKVISQNLKLQK